MKRSKEYRMWGRASLTGRWKTAVLALLALAGVVVVWSVVIGLIIGFPMFNMAPEQLSDEELILFFFKIMSRAFAALGLSLVVMIFLTPAMRGRTLLHIRFIRKEAAPFGVLFDPYRRLLGKSIGLYFLRQLYLMLWAMIPFAGFFIVMVKSFSYALSDYILLDNPGMTVNDAITKSRQMMDGKKWKLFCLTLSFIGWFILVGLTLGILALYVVPYMNAARAAFYEDIKADHAKINPGNLDDGELYRRYKEYYGNSPDNNGFNEPNDPVFS